MASKQIPENGKEGYFLLISINYFQNYYHYHHAMTNTGLLTFKVSPVPC